MSEHRTWAATWGISAQFNGALCGCGWYGPIRSSRTEAETDAQHHETEGSLVRCALPNKASLSSSAGATR